MKTLKFPDGFLWGTGTSAFQVEGNTPPCNWTKGAEEGFVPEIGQACDHYNRFEGDFDIAQELGHNAHRFSIEWGRIQPSEKKFDADEIAHYRSVIQALRKRGLEPIVTLWHFTIPLWLLEKGGLESSLFPEYFARYCEYVTNELGGTVHYWITINEPLPVANNGWLRGSWPPFKKWWLDTLFKGFGYPGKGDRKRPTGSFLTYLKVRRHLARAHNKAYQLIKRNGRDSSVGIAKHTIYYHSDKNLLNQFCAVFMNWFWTYSFMSHVHKQCDFIGINQYFDKEFGREKSLPKTDIGWEIYPLGLFGALSFFKRYGKPLYVTENGIADATDKSRTLFIRDNLREVHRAIQVGLDVRGYFYWSLMDNYELAEGYTMRFGLVEVDFETQERKVRPSAYEYKKICENNALTVEE